MCWISSPTNEYTPEMLQEPFGSEERRSVETIRSSSSAQASRGSWGTLNIKRFETSMVSPVDEQLGQSAIEQI
jgi:hypothetical protein